MLFACFSALVCIFGDNFFSFFFSPSSSYESSWIKSPHYKTIRSEASSNAAGIRCSLPTAAVRDGGEIESGWEGLPDANKGGRTASMTHSQNFTYFLWAGFTSSVVAVFQSSYICCFCYFKKNKNAQRTTQHQSVRYGSPISDPNVANSSPWWICSQSLDHRLIMKVIRSALWSSSFRLFSLGANKQSE